MFTGLIEDVGQIVEIAESAGSRELAIAPSAIAVAELALGESVACDGVCLTVTARDAAGGTFRVLAGPETLARTTLGGLARGGRLNLERAVRPTDRLGGHIVSGHVDGVGTLAAAEPLGPGVLLRFAAPAPLLRYIVEKGSIAVDGISLTVNQVDERSFAVALIPHTVSATTLAAKEVGARVNLETDIIGKYVEKLLKGMGYLTMRFARVLRAIDDIRAGRMVILVDDEDRENEGDLTMAAEKVTPEAINFMARHGRGLICLTLTEERIARLQLPMMVHDNRAPMGTAFTVSIEARHGVTTGISAQDRAVTIRAAVARDARAEDVVSPGHVFPLKARRGGVLVRTGQTEGSVDLARLAGLEPAGVICEIMRDDGQMARMPDLETFAETHGILILSIAELIDYRLQNERLVRRLSNGPMRPALPQLAATEFAAHVFGSEVEDTEYLALVLGDPAAAAARGESVLVRVQSMCPVGDVFASRACDCRAQLEESLRTIAAEGLGVFLYVHPRSRTSLRSSFDGHVLHTPRAEGGPGALRDFGLGAQVLSELGVRKIRLLSNNPKKIAGIAGYGIEVVERVAIEAPPTTENVGWLRDRREREGHLLVAVRGTGTGKDD